MTGIAVVIFFAGIALAFILDDKKSSKLFYTKRIEELEKEVSRLEDYNSYLTNRVQYLNGELERIEFENSNSSSEEGMIDEIELQLHNNSMSFDDYNDSINEIIKDAQFTTLERIYYESQLTDQIHDAVHLVERVKQQLDYLDRKGIDNNDIYAAKEIIQRSVPQGESVNFEGFITYTIRNKGKELTADIYPALIKMFKVAGYHAENTENIYDKYLKD